MSSIWSIRQGCEISHVCVLGSFIVNQTIGGILQFKDSNNVFLAVENLAITNGSANWIVSMLAIAQYELRASLDGVAPSNCY